MRNRHRLIVWILLLLAAAEFVARGPLRYLHPTNWNDLAQYYATSRLWLRGQNFADPENFAALWRNEVGETLGANTVRVRIAPPPGTLVIFAPFAALSWPAAKFVWLLALLLAFAATICCMIRYARLSVDEPRTLLFIAGCLALAPFHTGFGTGNQTILVVGCCAAGVYAAAAERDTIAGLFFGVACSLKPHIGAFLVVFYVLRGRWRLLVSAVGFATALVLVAVARMRVVGVHWFADYVSNIQFAAARNRIDDFTTANPIRFMLINLQVPFFSFTHNAKSANLLAFAIGGILILIWTFFVLRNRSEKSELLALATVAVIGLLPLYHRLYDASILAIPLCWCVTSLDELKAVARVSLLLMAPFLAPGAALLQEASRRGHISSIWSQSWWWDRLLMPHQTWLLLLLAAALLYGMGTSRVENETNPLVRS